MTLQGEGDPPASSRVTQPRHLAVLCYLTLARPRGLHERDTIVSLLWPGASEGSGRRALRNALYSLRRKLGPSVVVSTGGHLIGVSDAKLSCDAHDLERGIAPLKGAEVNGSEPLEGLHVTGAAPFDRWMDAERHRLRELLSRARAAPANEFGAQAVRGRRLHAVDVGALYARGHYLFLRAAHGGSSDDLMRSREYYERALALDDSFAPALAGLANFYAVAARRGVLTPFHDVFARTIALSVDAARRDPALAVPHVHFAVKALYLDDDWETAGREFATAAVLEPDYAEGRRFYGVWLGLVRRYADALHEMEAAASLEPDIPHILSSLAAARLSAGDRVGAEEALRRTLRLDPGHVPARERLVRVMEQDGRFDEAAAERERPQPLPNAGAFRAALTSMGAAGYQRCLVTVLQREAEALEERSIQQRAATPNEIFAPPLLRLASIYAQLGDWKRVRVTRLRAIADRPALAQWFASMPELDAAANGASVVECRADFL